MRDAPSAGVTLRSSLLAVGAALTVTLILLLLGSPEPLGALRAFFVQPFANRYYFGNMVGTTGYLLIAALGIVIAFRSGLYNLGGEGQLYAGGLAGTLVGLAVPNLPGIAGIVIILVVATATGAILGGIPGVLRRAWGTPELITSYLLAAATIPVADYLIGGPANDPHRNLLATADLARSYWLPRILPPSELNLSFPIALLLAALVFVVLFRTVRGYELRLFGINEHFATYAGVNRSVYEIGTMAASGGFHALAGALLVLGSKHAAIVGMSGGMGWNAIACALVGRLHPLGAIVSAFVFAYLDAGSKAAMLHTDFTFELGTIIRAVILLLVTASVFISRRRA